MTLGYEFQPVDVSLPDHPRFIEIDDRLQDAALGRYVRGLCYARFHKTNGRLPRGFARGADPKVVAELVRVGLWIARDDGGWDIHNWEAKSGRGSTGAARTKRWREKQRAANDSRDAGDASPVTPSDVTVTRHTVTDSSLSLSLSSSDSSSPADQINLTGGSIGTADDDRVPNWFLGAAQTVHANTGLAATHPESLWLDYRASRDRKGGMSHRDACGWIASVLRREKREADARPKGRGAEITKQPYDENAPWLKLPEVG